MSAINSLDLKPLIENALSDVFDTMLSKAIVPHPGAAKANGDRAIVGSVGFAGKVMGNINIHISETFGRVIAAAMLGMEMDEIDGEEEIFDVLGEVCNMVGGDLKSRLCDADLPCELSIPSITSGSDFNIEPKGWVRHETYGFRCEDHTAIVEVFMKSGA